MALAPLKLPKLQGRVPIVDSKGQPTSAFVRYWNIDFIGAIEGQINGLAVVQAGLAAAQAEIVTVQGEQAAQQALLATQITQIQALLGIAQSATQAANDAQATADAALGAGTVSGSETDPVIDLISNGIWVTGPVLSLTSVLAGDLTLTGSGPIQDADVDLIGGSTAAGQFRLVEVVSGVDTVLLTESFSVDGSVAPCTVTNLGSGAVAAYLSARSSTGAVDYRIDARKTSGASVTSLALYIYARRAA